MEYYIRQHKKRGSGRHDVSNFRQWIREEKVWAEVEFSVDGHEWLWGIEMLGFLPPERRRRHPKRRR